ncbi:hypothetical protein AAY473_021371 [Plecturocebus cupreus]
MKAGSKGKGTLPRGSAGGRGACRGGGTTPSCMQPGEPRGLRSTRARQKLLFMAPRGAGPRARPQRMAPAWGLLAVHHWGESHR